MFSSFIDPAAPEALHSSCYHAVTAPRVLSVLLASQSVAYREPRIAVPHQPKRRKRLAFSLMFAAFALALPIRFERTTLALGKPCSIQLSYGSGWDGWIGGVRGGAELVMKREVAQAKAVRCRIFWRVFWLLA